MAFSVGLISPGCVLGSLAPFPSRITKRGCSTSDPACMRSPNRPNGFRWLPTHSAGPWGGNKRYHRMGVEGRAGLKVAPPSHGYDYYDLLGVDSTASTASIKKAYRWLQKRCHPDVAQELGHDMAVLLNEAYSTLINEETRAVYDQMRIVLFADNNYTGEPVYSTWRGPEEEDRAIFVDETQCVGCLKCALIAKNTFAIEMNHGRARAVQQWGDGQDTVFDAITACPVDCIKLVERAKLPALEYVMAQQSQVPVGMDCHNNGGKRVVNVFSEAQRFLEKLEYRRKNRREAAEETPAQRMAREAAAVAIQARAGRWWYRWASSFGNGDPASSAWSWTSASQSRGALLHLRDDVAAATAFAEAAAAASNRRTSPEAARSAGEDVALDEELRLLREAAEKRRAAGTNGSVPRGVAGAGRRTGAEYEYWSPEMPVSQTMQEEEVVDAGTVVEEQDEGKEVEKEHWQRISTNSDLFRQDIKGVDYFQGIFASGPLMVAAAAAMYVIMTTADTSPSMAAIDSPLPAEFTSGLMGRVIMASLAWYLVAAVVSGFVALSSAILYDRRLNVEEPTENTEESQKKN